TATRSGVIVRPCALSSGVWTSTSTVGSERTASRTNAIVSRLASVRKSGGGVPMSRRRVSRCWARGWSTTTSDMPGRIVPIHLPAASISERPLTSWPSTRCGHRICPILQPRGGYGQVAEDRGGRGRHGGYGERLLEEHNGDVGVRGEERQLPRLHGHGHWRD